MMSTTGRDGIHAVKKAGRQYLGKPRTGWGAPLLVAVCMALLFPASVLGPSGLGYSWDSPPALSVSRDDLEGPALNADGPEYVRVAIVRCYFTQYPGEAIWDYLNASWSSFGTKGVIIDYDSLAVPTITPEALESSDADVLYMSYGGTWTASELGAIVSYVKQGHGLVLDTNAVFASNEMWQLLGLGGDVTASEWVSAAQGFNIMELGHPVVQGLSDPFSNTYPLVASPVSSGWTESTMGSAACVAMSGDGLAVILAHRGLVYFSHLPVYPYPSIDDEAVRLVYNAMVWSHYNVPQHEISVRLETPALAELGEANCVNMTVVNDGLSNETGIDVFLYDDGLTTFSTVVSYLESGTNCTIVFDWTPLSSGTHSLTASVSLLVGEESYSNNVDSLLVYVGHLKHILWDTSHGNMAPEEFSILTDEMNDRGFTLNLFSGGPIGGSALEGYDVLVVARPAIFYSTNESEAIRDFVLGGAGLLVIGDSDVSILNDLTDYAGIEWSSASVGLYGPYEVWHPVTDGLVYCECYDAQSRLNVTWPAIGLRDYSGGYFLLAVSQIGLGKIVCITDDLMLCDDYVLSANLGLGVNSFCWLAEDTHEHDLWAHAHAWTPTQTGYASPITVTVLNSGTSVEKYVIIRLYLDGLQVLVDFLPVMNRSILYSVDYGWTPTRSGTYNFTVVVETVLGETRTEDNRYTCLVRVADLTIEILSDDDFVTQGWPGLGTPQEPYVIGGFNIMGYWSEPICIIVTDTRAHFVISNCTFTDLDDTVDGAGIRLWNVTNGRILNNTFTLGQSGMYVYNSSLCTICNNSFAQYSDGLLIEDSADLIVTRNTLTGNGNAMRLLSADFNAITNNTCANSTWGLILDSECNNNSISWNEFDNLNNMQDDGVQNDITENYYSDYSGADGDHDGLGDTPYAIAGASGSEDPRPLVLPREGPFVTWLVAPSDMTIEYSQELHVELQATGYTEIAGYWVNNTAIVTVDGNGMLTNATQIAAGIYVLEVRGFDHYGHYCSAVFTLTVLDGACPEWIQEPSDRTVEIGDLFCYDLNATDFSGLHAWWLNDTSGFSISTEGIVTMNYLLPVGVYHIRVSVNDTLGNVLTQAIRIEVVDTQPPAWVVVPELAYVNYGDDAALLVQADDRSGIDHYWVNDTARFGVGGNGVVTSVVLLPCGEIPLEVRAYDSYGHYCSADVVVVVVDVTIPTVNHPEDITYTEGQAGNSITWQASDDNPGEYEVLRDGIVVKAGLWNSSSEQIAVSVDGLAPGLYSYVLLVYDAGDHAMSDSVMVTVLMPTTTTTTVTTTTTPVTTTTTTTGVTTTQEISMMLLAIGISVTSVAVAVIVIVMARKGMLGH